MLRIHKKEEPSELRNWMKLDMDAIRFESRAEIETIMQSIDDLVRLDPIQKKNEELKRPFELLGIMYMNWYRLATNDL